MKLKQRDCGVLKVRFGPRVRWFIPLAVVVIASLGVNTVAIAGPSRANGAGGMTQIECEYLLSEPSDYASARNWFMNAVAKIQGPDDIFRGDSPSDSAFHALGLPTPFPRGSKLQLEVPVDEEGKFLVHILAGNGTQLAQYSFHFPPYLAWKRTTYSPYLMVDSDEAVLKVDLSQEDPREISVGALIGDLPNGGRRFLSVRVRQSNLVTIAIGIDVRGIYEYRKFSDAPEPRILGGSDEIIYTRVEVIKAHFRVPAPPPRRKHGPQRIT